MMEKDHKTTKLVSNEVLKLWPIYLFVVNLQQDRRIVKNYEPKLSYILAELFKMSPQKSCFFRLLENLIRVSFI